MSCASSAHTRRSTHEGSRIATRASHLQHCGSKGSWRERFHAPVRIGRERPVCLGLLPDGMAETINDCVVVVGILPQHRRHRSAIPAANMELTSETFPLLLTASKNSTHFGPTTMRGNLATVDSRIVGCFQCLTVYLSWFYIYSGTDFYATSDGWFLLSPSSHMLPAAKNDRQTSVTPAAGCVRAKGTATKNESDTPQHMTLLDIAASISSR